MYCDQCGATNDENAKVCSSCGARIDSIETDESKETKAIYAALTNSGFIKKAVPAIVGIVAVVLIVFIIKGIFGALSGSDEPDYSKHPVVYIKNSDVYVKPTNNDEPYLMSDSITNNFGYGMVQTSNDGSKVFFIDGIAGEETALYYRKVSQKEPKGKNADEKGIKIDVGLTNFQASEDGKYISYLKGTELYVSDLKNSHKVAEDVVAYWFSTDIKKIMFEKSNGDAYFCGLKKNDKPEKIGSEIGTIVSKKGEYEDVYYTKDSSLFRKRSGKDKVKVVSDIHSASLVGETLFVVRANQTEKKFEELFNKSTASSKTELEVIRDYYNQYPQSVSDYTIYKVKGDKVKEIKNGISSFASNMRIIYMKQDKKISLNSITTLNDARSKVAEVLSGASSEAYLLKEDGSLVKTDYKNSNGIAQVSEDEKFVYWIERDSGEPYGDLVRYKIGNELKSREVICSKAGGYIIYEKDVIVYTENNGAGIYNGKKYTELSNKGSGVCRYYKGVVYYLSEYNINDSMGDLMRYKNGKKELVDTEVHDFIVRGENDCFYIKNYDSQQMTGDLYRKKGGKSTQIDTQISRFIH